MLRGPPSPPGTTLLLVLLLLHGALADEHQGVTPGPQTPTTTQPAPPLPPGYFLRDANSRPHNVSVGYLPALKGEIKERMVSIFISFLIFISNKLANFNFF
jgi:hypothetical protein